jgi:Putative metallopeptidase
MFKIFRLALVLVTLVGLPVTKLGSQAAEAKTTLPTTTTKSDPKLLARHQSGGRIEVVYGESDDPFSVALMEADREQGFYQAVADKITSEIRLPRNVTVVLRDCGQANAFYDRNNHSITMCNELTKASYERFKAAGDGDEAALESAIFSSIFYFFHEAGHLVTGELNLPIVGREEDVADQFSAFFLLSNDPSEDKSNSSKILLSAAQLFRLTSEKPTQSNYLDEHGLNQQRFYNIICMLYGKSPENYRQLISSLNYPESRAASCQQELNKMFDSWQRLLEPYLVENYGG